MAGNYFKWQCLAVLIVVLLVIISNLSSSTKDGHPDDVKQPKSVKKILKQYPIFLKQLIEWAKDKDWKSIDLGELCECGNLNNQTEQNDMIDILFPSLIKQDRAYLVANADFKNMYEQAFYAMCRFYGIKIGSKFTIGNPELFETFFIKSGPNHKRITKILAFLHQMRSRYYISFKKFALKQAEENQLTEITIECWNQA